MARENKRKRDERRFGRVERLADLAESGSWHMSETVVRGVSAAGQIDTVRPAWDEAVANIKAAIRSGPVVVADNVSEYYFAQNPKDNWIYKTDFPACVPPWPVFFLESVRPSGVLSERGFIPFASWVPRRWGWLFETFTRAELEADHAAHRDQIRNHIKSQLDNIYKKVDFSRIEAARSMPDREAAWASLGSVERTFVALGKALEEHDKGASLEKIDVNGTVAALVSGTLIWADDRPGILGPIIQCTYPIDAQGKILADPLQGIFCAQYVSRDDMEEMSRCFSLFFPPALLAISFMNCKNVSVAAREPDRDHNRARRKAGLKPFLRYHVIDIDPMKKVLRTEGRAETEGLKRALHICRGHFATYSEDRPLFGRIVGMFWRPMHVRGTMESGIVTSDYRVHPVIPESRGNLGK